MLLSLVICAACGSPGIAPDATGVGPSASPTTGAAAAPTGGVSTVAETGAMAAPSPTVSPAAAERGALTVTDATGAKIALPERPRRIACLTDICTDILFELGLEPVAVKPNELAFRPEFYGERAKRFATIGGSFLEPNVEDVAAAEPDLVIGLGGVHEGLRDALKPIAPLYIMLPATPRDSVEYLREVGRLTGRTERAEAAARAFVSKLERYRAASPKDKVVAIAFAGAYGFSVDTTDSVYGSMLAEVTRYPWPPLARGGATPYTVEQVLERDPDVIFGVSMNEAGLKGVSINAAMANDSLWKQLKAVREDRVHDVDPLVWAYGRGTRSLGLVLDEAMTTVYPEVFPDPLP
jgi:iron complex transport system substrate-binding protein